MVRLTRRNDPEIDALQRQLVEDYPTLCAHRDGPTVRVRGTFPVTFQGIVLDRYQIELDVPRRNDHLPAVREIGGRIPRTKDNHVEEDGNICLMVPDERWKTLPPGSTITDFLKGPVHQYFLGHSLVELGEPRPFGERGHGATGIIESYAELLKTIDVPTIVRYLKALSKGKIKPHYPCPCGNGRRASNCHAPQLRDLRAKIPRRVAKTSYERIKRELLRPQVGGKRIPSG